MDPTEDLSARVLLTHILSTEPPRSPITRSASNTQSTLRTRSSSRLSKKDAGAHTPQDVLRRSLKQKMRESITRQSLPARRRRTASVVSRRTNTPAPTSELFDNEDTPRHMLMNILRTEPVKSPVVHEKAAEEPRPSSADSSITKRPSIELSGFDLPDITIGIAASTAKGLSRKRQRRSLNVTAFEKCLKDGEDVDEENENLIGDLSSLHSQSSTSFSLKTPFVDLRTEKRGLQRRVSNRRKISEEEFGAAVNKRELKGVSSFVQAEQGLNETAYSEGFTLGLSKSSEPDITTDILNCNTALYAQTSSFSIIATRDKPTVLVEQMEAEQMEAEQMEAEQSELGKEKSMYAFPTEEGAELKNKSFSQSEEDAGAAKSQKEEEKRTAEDAATMSEEEESESEEENRVEAQTEEKDAADSPTEEEAAAESQTEEEIELDGNDSKPEEDATAMSEDEEAAPDSQTEEDEVVESQTEKVAGDSQIIEEEEEEEEDGAVDLQSEEDVADYQSDQDNPEANSQSEEQDNLADSQPEDEHDGKPEEEDGEQASEQQEHDLEHVAQRAQRSEGGLIMPLTEVGVDSTEAGWSDDKSKAQSSLEMGSHESGQLHVGISDQAESSTRRQTHASYAEAEPDADKENFHLPEVLHDTEDWHLSDDSPEEAAAQDSAEQEEVWEDEEDEIPSKTPAFVRQKLNFFQPNPQTASPSVFKDIDAISSTGEGLPAAKPKQVRQRRKGPAKKEAELPKSYLMSVFKHFAKTKVSADVYPVLKTIMDKYFDRLAEDLETYAVHAKRKTIEVEDAELLLKRQGHVNSMVPVEVLIEKYLRMDQRSLLIPIATSGNVVIPKRRR
ncbi:LOW QUALITY PROTEIN: enolase-phosphatase E1 [Cottoperca gobio]|uniref:LOW QUALITY PROTEIN: enolase-phosphatase E1 n=1 Tax=Cottoperca gobio TaxID=56716 RepID=A0A6J2RT23_COTGO|nr:LOW QUALITY PROTEIN: centromere protein T [Cottoperca gobio]